MLHGGKINELTFHFLTPATMMTQSIATTAMRQLSSCSVLPFVVHSTFRDCEGRQLLPRGLEWDADGDSHVTYLPADSTTDHVDMDDPRVRRGIVQAHNRWCFAKQVPFKRINDILSLSTNNGKHLQVHWKDTQRIVETEIRNRNIANLIKDETAAWKSGSSIEIWINGEFVSVLNGEDTLAPVLEAVTNITSVKVSLKRSDGLIRIERYFTGGLRDRVQVFDHIMDNLIALEDPQILDDQTLIGTATLPDWIMGGNLTSRLWVRELDNKNILFLRPLRNDDINTSDRQFELIKGQDDEEIRRVQVELKRLRILASFTHPYVAPENVTRDPMAEVKKELSLNRRHRKVFGL